MRVIVAGASLRGPGYPNAWNTVRLLRDKLGLEIVETGLWLPDSFHLWKISRGAAWRSVMQLSWLFAANLVSSVRTVFCYRRGDLVYVPYPGLFMMWLFSWIPSGVRPRCIVDSYISVWDSLYRDRGATSVTGIMSKLLRWVEGRGLRAAWRVIADTEANRQDLAELFQLNIGQVRAFPLAIDERTFAAVEREGDSACLEVLFVGTFVPLHGITTLLEGVRPLLADHRFRFVFLGDGQSAPAMEEFLAECAASRVEWVREWCAPDEIAKRIADADVCLGVFGGHGKAARVLPFKLYMYFAMGKPVVSQPWLSQPEGAPPPPIIGVWGSVEISRTLTQLLELKSVRLQHGCENLNYYQEYLSNESVSASWRELVLSHDPWAVNAV